MITLALLIGTAFCLAIAVFVIGAIFALPLLDVAVAVFVIWGIIRVIITIRNRK